MIRGEAVAILTGRLNYNLRMQREDLSHRKMEMTERKDDRLWGGRFDRAPNEEFDAFQRSFSFDRRLLPYEIAVDRAWAKALQAVGIFNQDEVRLTVAALDKIEKRTLQDVAWLDNSGAEDVHHFRRESVGRRTRPTWMEIAHRT